MEHHAIGLEGGGSAVDRLTGQMLVAGQLPEGHDAMFGAELWWKGVQAQDAVGRASDSQLLINQESPCDDGLLPDNQYGSASDGVGTQTGGRPAGERAAAARSAAGQPG